VGVQRIGWEKDGTEQAEYYTFFYKEGNKDHQLEAGFFVHERIIPEVRSVEFIVVGCHI
jgi:hypothetical protein